MYEPPVIPLELLEWLEKHYPDQSPDIKTPERAVWWKAGQADLVKRLRITHEQQNETILKGST